MNGINDDNLIQEFVSESLEHLASIEPDLLTLEREQEKSDQEIINRLFRAIHSIKGTSGFFGFESLKRLSHVMESLMMKIRDKEIVPTPVVIEPLLLGVDKLRVLIEDVYGSDDVPCDEEIRKIESVLGSPKSAGQPSQAKKKVKKGRGKTQKDLNRFQVELSVLEKAAAHGQKLYTLILDVDQDLIAQDRGLDEYLDHLITLGDVLDVVWPWHDMPEMETCLEEPVKLHVFYVSVLEQDLLALDLNVPEERFTLIDKQEALAHAVSTTDETTEDTEGISDEDTPEEDEETERAQAASESRTAQRAGSTEARESIRVKVNLLNNLMDLAGELVLSRNQLLRSAAKEIAPGSKLSNIVQNIDFLASELQEHIMQTRMQPIGTVFAKLPRLVRDIAHQMDKEIEIHMSGEDVELDKSILECLSDPLVHLIRNCCDHGIEDAQERSRAGKSPIGTIDLRAFHEGGQIIISINDDGRGIDHNKVVKKALQNGLITEAEAKKLPPQERLHLIFMPGFSTADQVTEVSGRGVGMDVVKTNIEKIGGHISVDTTLNKGTTILLRLPLTLAIIPSLIVASAGQYYALPQINVVELVRVRADELTQRIEKVGQANILRLRGKLVPLLHLADVLGLEQRYFDRDQGQYVPDRRQELADVRKEDNIRDSVIPTPENRRRSLESDYNIVVLKVGADQFGLVVNRVIEMEEIVVKPLSGYLKNCKCFSGATILGDGVVAMILDIGGVIQQSGLNFGEIDMARLQVQMGKIRSKLHEVARQESIILFHNAEDEYFAMPLSSLLRLEKIKTADISSIGEREFVTYQEKALPILRLEHFLEVKPSPDNLEEAYLIIPKNQGDLVGIFASRVSDKQETSFVLDRSLVGKEGVCSSTVINNQLVTFIHPHGLLKEAGYVTGE